tara:strand:- start:40 stop:375 length:336 start_codon:yes stop_codon:yes gene_type:complete
MKRDIKKLYYSIGEVSKLVGLKSYVLRYWETEFKQLTPPKNRAGNRTYRQKDIDLILKIKDLLHGKKFTIEGARSVISSKVSSNSTVETIDRKIISQLKNELQQILQVIKN